MDKHPTNFPRAASAADRLFFKVILIVLIGCTLFSGSTAFVIAGRLSSAPVVMVQNP